MFNQKLTQLLSVSALVSLLLLAQPATAQEMAVDLNTASASELAETLEGVGEVRAQAIVSWRESNGRFVQVDDLTQVEGIGPSILEMNRTRLRTTSD